MSSVWALAVLGGLVGGAGEKTFSFAGTKVGELPAGWKAAQTGKGQGSVWKVAADKSAPSKAGLALAQTARGPAGNFFNLCVAQDTNYRDLDLSVAFKAMAGELDQGGGPVWRYQDANNYYVCRMNPLEDNVRVYKVIAGTRIQIGSNKAKAETGTWHTIRVVHKANQIKCYFDGKLHLDVTDDSIAQAGQIGLWTKSDAQTSFDQIRVTNLAK
jgi:hypothetical protein